MKNFIFLFIISVLVLSYSACRTDKEKIIGMKIYEYDGDFQNAALREPSKGFIFFSWPLFEKDTVRMEIIRQYY